MEKELKGAEAAGSRLRHFKSSYGVVVEMARGPIPEIHLQTTSS